MLLSLAAFAAGAIVTRRKLALIVPLVSVLPWLVHPGAENWICWKESQVNSVARRAWTEAAAHYFQTNYQPGQGILAPFGDVTGIFCKAGIPLAQVLHEGNGPAWYANTTRPDLIHQESMAVAQEGTKLSGKLQENAQTYRLVDRIQTPNSPALQIFKRIPMTKIPFTKLHGAENDFLLTWGERVTEQNLPELARRICARTTGVGADGWMLVWRAEGGLRTRLFNSDGSEPEISGNGTRCAAAFALLNEAAAPPLIAITTAAGRKELRLVSQQRQ